MARSVAVWVGGAATACLLIGVGYLPPRGLPKWAEGRPYPSFAPNQQRARARELLTRWQVANAALLRARYHDQLGPLLAAQRKGEHLGPALILETDSATRRFGEGIIRAAFDSAWRQLNLGVTKVSIGILMQDRPPVTERKGPPVVPGTFSSTYLLPDSVDRATCLVVTQTPFFATNKTYLNQARLVRWATGVLGPCAYYAKFGVPSPRVEQWLATRQFDVAILPSWSARSWAGPEDLGWRISFMLQERELWWGIYSYAPNVLSCFAGRPEACRRDLQTADRVEIGRAHV